MGQLGLLLYRTVRFSILLNRAPQGVFFVPKRIEIRDPPSHFLFIIVMEGLRNTIKFAYRNNWLRGFNVGSSIEVSHVLYTDDSLGFLDAKVE